MPRHGVSFHAAVEADLFAWLEALLSWLAPWLAAKNGPGFDPNG